MFVADVWTQFCTYDLSIAGVAVKRLKKSKQEDSNIEI